jgi:hypothetical protein
MEARLTESMNEMQVLTQPVAERLLAMLQSGEWVDLSSFSAIHDDAAAVLSQHDGGLELDGLTSLSEVAAKALASSSAGVLSLKGLTHLPDAVANALGCFQGSVLSLDGLQSLTDAAALGLGRFPGSLSLNELAHLSTKAIKSLLAQGDALSLKGLDEIPDTLAKQFADAGSWPELCLKRFPASPGHIALAGEISANITHSIAETERIEVLEPDIARAFAGTTAHLAFPAVREISLEVAQALAAHKKGNLRLSGVEQVSEPVAESLAQHGAKLFLANLASLDNTKGHRTLLQKLIKSQDYAEFRFTILPLWLADELLKALRKTKYTDFISFPALRVIDSEVLRLLCDFRAEGSTRGAELRLDGLAELPNGATEAISKHAGTISLRGLTHIPDAVAESLGCCERSFTVSGLKTLGSIAAGHLAKSICDLHLDGLENVEESVAASLAQHAGKRMTLCGIRAISSPALKHLARYVGALAFGLTALDSEQAAILAAHENDLELDCVQECDAATAQQLAQHRRLVSLKSLKSLSIDAARELSQHPGPLRIVLDDLPKDSADLLNEAFPRQTGVELRK